MNVLERFRNDEVVVENTEHAIKVLELLGLKCEGSIVGKYIMTNGNENLTTMYFDDDKDAWVKTYQRREIVDILEFEKLLNKDLQQPSKNILQEGDYVTLENERVYIVSIKFGKLFRMDCDEPRSIDLTDFNDDLVDISGINASDVQKIERFNGEHQLIAERKEVRIPTDADRRKMVRVRNNKKHAWVKRELICVADREINKRIYITYSFLNRIELWRYAELID